MRFPYQAFLRIIKVSPISDGQSDNPAFDTIYNIPCLAAATSGTFDPDIQFNGEALATGIFGQLIDVWISKPQHRNLIKSINDTGITFSAPLQLRLTNITRKLNNNRQESVLLFDQSAVEPLSPFVTPRGFPLKATRIFPSVTALTFELKRLGV